MAKQRGIRAKGNGIEVYGSVGGRRFSRYIPKAYNPTNLRYARGVRERLIDELKGGGSHLRGENPLFAVVAQDYLDAIRKRLSERHCINVKNDLNNIWLPSLGDKPIGAIRVRDVRQADAAWDWSSAKRQQNSRSILRQIFDFAIEDDLIDENPTQRLKAVSHQRAKIDPFNEAERDAALSQLSGEARRYYILAFETGMRTAELLGLDWADIRDGKAHLRQTLIGGELAPMKTKTERSVYLSQTALEALSADIRPLSGPVFTLTSKQLWRRWKAALEAAGVRYRRPYNCRHTRASIGLSAGQTPAWLAKQLGHDLRTFFERYADYIDGDSDEREMAKLEREARV